MPSFSSRKRFRRYRKKTGGGSKSFHFVAKTHMSAVVHAGTEAAIDPVLIIPIPSATFTTSGAYPTGYCSVEAIDGPMLCSYTPNFSRMFAQLPSAFRTVFKMVKFGTLTHTIRRVDSGANWGLFATGLTTYPTNMGTRDIPVYVNYRYVPVTESMSASTHDNWYRSRMKRVQLKPGRKLVFKHKLLVHSREYVSYLARYLRTIAGEPTNTREDVACSTWEMPTNFRKLGWLPTYLMEARDQFLGGDSSDQPFTDTAGTQGIRPGIQAGHRQDLVLMGNTVQFIFDVYQHAEQVLSAGGLDVGTWLPVNRPLIRRSESVPITLKGFSNVCGQDTVTQIIQCQEYPLSEPAGAYPARITQFAPPRFDTVERPPRNNDSTWAVPDRPYPVNVEQMPARAVALNEPLPLIV